MRQHPKKKGKKEYAMPDMKTALSAVLNEWAQDEQPQLKEKATMPTNFAKTPDNKVRFVPTNNVSRETFNVVLKNPGITRAKVTEALCKQGFNKASVSSLVGQYIRCNFFSQTEDGRLYCLLKEYKSLPSTKAQMAMVRRGVKPVKVKVAKSEGIAALKEKAADPSALYDELKKIFGG
jgi:hypothetical protein